jgi:hypothetical protein
VTEEHNTNISIAPVLLLIMRGGRLAAVKIC